MFCLAYCDPCMYNNTVSSCVLFSSARRTLLTVLFKHVRVSHLIDGDGGMPQGDREAYGYTWNRLLFPPAYTIHFSLHLKKAKITTGSDEREPTKIAQQRWQEKTNKITRYQCRKCKNNSWRTFAPRGSYSASTKNRFFCSVLAPHASHYVPPCRIAFVVSCILTSKSLLPERERRLC